ncbi:MAG: DUF3445 domain-containing protein, partial [Chloroflexi bacterium]|nr:DUF3445 domain-containing protein [Chloroflexota bacterium]
LRLTAGHLCFGSKWSLEEKIGHDVLEMHAPVPGFAERMGKPSQLLMERLKPGRASERVNWAINATNRLNLDPALRYEWEPLTRGVTPENAGERCFLRIERQVFHRLPRTGALLMTIHTYVHSIADVAVNAERRRRLASVLRSAPAATLDYKGISPFAAALIGYLEKAGA